MSFEKLTEWKDHDARTIIREPADDPSGIICFVRTWGHGEDTRYRAAFLAPDQEHGDWRDGEIRNPDENAHYWPTQQAAKDAADAAYLAWVAEQSKQTAAAMDLPEAQRIARQHLGDTLTTLMRGGPHGDDWVVYACHGGTEASAHAPTVDAAAADCAAQLRAAGWSPSHARLEWERKEASLSLALCVGSARIPIADILHVFGKVKLFLHTQVWRRRNTTDEAEAVAIISEWCAANLPYHLPDFPGASDAS